MKKRYLIGACTLSLFSSPEALGQARRGIMATLPSALTVDVTSGAATDLLIKREGDQTAGPVQWTSNTFPNPGDNRPWVDYSKQAMFGPLASHVVINAHSTGNAVIPPLDNEGVPNVGGGGTWMAVTVSVTNASIGGDGGLVQMRRMGQIAGSSDRTSPGSDLISHYYAESSGIPNSVSGRNFIEQAAEALGLGGTADDDVGALDYAMGVNTLNINTTDEVLFGSRHQYFFSVEQSSVANLNMQSGGHFAMDGGAMVPANAATVYQITCTTAATGCTWSTPTVYRSASDLGLDPIVHDIDALDLSTQQDLTIFSTVGPGLPSQLMIHTVSHSSSGGNQATFPLMTRLPVSGQNMQVVDRMRVNDSGDLSDVDAVCVIDPEANTFVSHLGTSQDSTLTVTGDGFGGQSPMTISCTRVAAANGILEDVLVVQVSGWGILQSVDPNGEAFGPSGPIQLVLLLGGNPIVLAQKDRAPGDLSVEFRIIARSITIGDGTITLGVRQVDPESASDPNPAVILVSYDTKIRV